MKIDLENFIRKCFHFCFSPVGRASIGELWKGMLVILTMGISAKLYDTYVLNFRIFDIGPVYLAVVVTTLWPTMALHIRRCHDRNKSGLFLVLLFIPVVFLWPSIELYMIKGKEVDNRYGS